jgi:hypothetical protein
LNRKPGRQEGVDAGLLAPASLFAPLVLQEARVFQVTHVVATEPAPCCPTPSRLPGFLFLVGRAIVR